MVLVPIGISFVSRQDDCSTSGIDLVEIQKKQRCKSLLDEVIGGDEECVRLDCFFQPFSVTEESLGVQRNTKIDFIHLKNFELPLQEWDPMKFKRFRKSSFSSRQSVFPFLGRNSVGARERKRSRVLENGRGAGRTKDRRAVRVISLEKRAPVILHWKEIMQQRDDERKAPRGKRVLDREKGKTGIQTGNSMSNACIWKFCFRR